VLISPPAVPVRPFFRGELARFPYSFLYIPRGCEFATQQFYTPREVGVSDQVILEGRRVQNSGRSNDILFTVSSRRDILNK
jgi:hypothetical protein